MSSEKTGRPDQPGHFSGGLWIAMLLTLALTNFMEVLDLTIANVSINNISGALGVSPNEGTWVITSYAVANAIAVPLASWLARGFGQVRIFTIAIVVFTASSWLCGMSVTLSMLLAARIVQGAVAGFMIPLSQALMINNSPPQRRGMALAVWGMTVTIAPIVGPLMGGWITDNYHWSWIFFINIPAGIVAAVATMQIFKGRETERVRQPVDAVGIALLVAWVGSLQIVLDKGNELDWFGSRFIVILTVIAAVGFVLFLIWELTDDHPVVDLSLFRYRNYTVGIIALCLGFGVYFASVVLLPLVLQTQLGFTATWSGRIAAPMGIFAALCSPIVGRLIGRVDPRYIASFGILIFAVCSFWRSGVFTTDTDALTLIWPQVLQGVGTACFFAPLININTAGMPPAKMASASSVQNFARMMMASFGTSIVVTYWDHRAALHRTQLVEQLPVNGARVGDAMNSLQALTHSADGVYGLLDRLVAVQSFLMAANDIFWLSGVILIAVSGVVWFARPPFGAGMGGRH